MKVVTLRLPYLIHCESHGNMSFHDGIRFNSDIPSNYGEDVMFTHFTRLFIKSGDKATDMEISLEEDYPIIRWTMNYGRLSPRRCWCKLEPVKG